MWDYGSGWCGLKDTTTELYFVCEVPRIQSDDLLECSVGSIAAYRDECFVLVVKSRYWGDAEEDCFFTYGGELPSIHNEPTNNLIVTVMENINSRDGFWIGATKHFDSPFFWWDGSSFNLPAGTYFQVHPVSRAPR